MIKRMEEIDGFLKGLSENPDIYSDYGEVYQKLGEYQISKVNLNEPYALRDAKVEILKYNSKKFHFDWNGNVEFDQYSTEGLEDIHDEIKYREIKLYLSLDKENAAEIFVNLLNLLKQKNIMQASKLSYMLRSDDCVIRVYSMEDAKIVIDFINKNYSNKIKTEPNPFLFRDGKVGIAMDNGKSFNRSISFFISKYIKKLNKDNKLDTAGIDGFKNYIKDIYSSVYEVGTGIEDFIKDKPEPSTTEIDYLVQNKSIMELFMIFLDDTKDLDSIRAFYDKIKNGYEINTIKESIRKKVKDNGFMIEDLESKEYILKELRNGSFPSIYFKLDDDLKNDPEIAFEAAKKDGSIISSAGENIKSNQRIVLEALKTYPQAIKYADSTIRKKKEIVLDVLKQDGLLLEYADKTLQKEFDIVIVAVKQNPYALEYADETLQNNPIIVREAFLGALRGLDSADIDEILDISVEIYNDRELSIDDVLIINEEMLEFVGKNLKDDEEFMNQLLEDGLNILMSIKGYTKNL